MNNIGKDLEEACRQWCDFIDEAYKYTNFYEEGDNG